MPQWPQLELLADFMEVGTIPTRWCVFPGEEKVPDAPDRYVYPAPINGWHYHSAALESG